MSGSIIEMINKFGVFFCDHALRMLIQSSILIAALLIIDYFIRKRIKAVLRYCIWLLVFVKLVTPATLSLPTGIGYWLGDLLPEKSVQKEIYTQPQVEYSTGAFTLPPTLPQVESHKPVINLPAAHTPVLETPVIIPAAPSVNKQGIIFLIWLVGELILLALFLQRTFFVKRIIAQSKPAESGLQEILGDSCKKIGIKKKVELKVSKSLQSPAACGLIKPKIILPSSLLKCFSSEKLYTTMLHELAHIKRKDIWINSLQTFLQIFYFYNPLLWFANIIVRRIREQAVDETVLVYLGEKADTYSSTLVDIAEIAFAKPSLGLNMIGVVESKKALTARIRHILSRPFPTKIKLGITGLLTIIFAAFVLIPMAKADRTNSQKTYTAEELLEKIIESENKIQNMEAHCNINELHQEGDKLLWVYDWGYENSKEYKIEYNLKENNAPDIEQIHTFDGDVQMVMNYDANRSNYGVMIQKYNGIIHGMSTPKTLLGYSLNYLAQESLGTFISKAKELRVKEEREDIDSHSCIVLEAIGLYLIDDHEYKTCRDARIWIDTERDFRPLKIETYDSYSYSKKYAGRKPWDILNYRIDNIELKKINGIWFPVSGEKETFHIKDYLPPEGMTRKEFRDAYADSNLTSKEIEELLTPIVEPSDIGKRRIDITNIKINKGIPADKFTIELLDGYTVSDEFLDKYYIVGEPSEEEVFISDDEVLAEIHDLSPAELVKLIHTERLGQNNKKWRAVIYRLAEIGSPAIPAITEELEKTETPIKQSKLVFTLRAIGDPNAVPALCDALERCVNSSDYGLGEVHSNSKIEMFYRRYQVKPEDESLGLGRPVREITISLERLTGHSEGHDHFNAYDAEGNQLGSYIITPEIVERQKEHRKQVAQQWRTWWGENKDSVELTPAPAEISVNSDTKRTSGGVLAAPEGAMISFAIVPKIGDSSKQPNLSYEENQKYLDDIEEDGPYLGAVRGDSFQWEMAMQGYSQLDGLSTGTYKNRTYVLVCARAKYVMRPVVENKRLWSLEEVGPAIDAQGKPAVYIRFDEKGAEQFAEFTRANVGNRMTISMDYFGIISIPYIMSALSRELIITGDFTDDQVTEMVDRLQEGMIIEQVPSELIQAAEEIKKEDIPNMSPGEFIKNLLTAGFAHNMEKVLWFVPDMTELINVDDFAQIADGDKVDVVDAYSDGEYALVITSEIKAKDESDTSENGQLVFFLKKQEGIWRIDEVDVTNLRNAQWFVNHFKEKHPDAKPGNIQTEDTEVNAIVEAAFIGPDPGHYMAVLPNGVSVELVGVCEHPSEGKQWWKPDGSVLENAPYEKPDRIRDANDSNKIRELAIYFGGSYAGDAHHLIFGLGGEKQGNTSVRLNYVNDNLTAIKAIFSKDKKSTTVPLSVAAGQWETRAVSNGKYEETSYLLGGEAIFGKAAGVNGKSTISMMDKGSCFNEVGEIRFDCRIIAKDIRGDVLTGREVPLAQRGPWRTYSYEFEIPLEQIAIFEFQTRPYYRVEFEDVALEPGEKTDVQINVSESGKRRQTEIQTVEMSTVTPPVWITYLPVSPIRSLTDYQHSQKVESLSSEKVKICELEIRAASDNKRIAKITYDNYSLTGSRWGCKLNKQQIQEIGAIKNGTYLAAMYVNGIRSSNVAEFTIDSNADLSSEPALKLVSFPLSVGQVLPSLGIIATGPNPTDPELEQSAIYFPNLFVDGIERKPIAMKWAGPDRVIEAGSQDAAILDLENYTPAIALNEPHEVWAKLGKYQSATVVMPASYAAGENWDEITERFYPATPPVVMLEGTILGLDGKPVSFNVSVSRENGKGFNTISDSNGKYEFVNLPVGKYQLFCSPPKLGQPAFSVSDIQIREGHKEIVNLDFTSDYSISGTVRYEDGSPAANLDVVATWEDAQTEFMNYDRTDEQGHYSISSPFEVTSYVGIGLMQPGYITPKQPYRNVKSGRDDVNFVLKKVSPAT